ncbi:MAG: cyclic nucleotide-binding domain-containing protein [Chromatiales bacterium]
MRLLIPVNGLAPTFQDQIIKESEILTFRKRDYVFHQGSRDSYTYYLLEGTLELIASDQIIKQIDGGTGPAFFPVAQLQPRQMSAKATTPVTVLRVNRVLLDKLLSLASEPISQDGNKSGIEVEVIDGGDADWVGSLLQSELFSRVPASNISKLLSTIESVAYVSGDVVVRQGDVGDYYYLIRSGRCEVLRNTSSGQEIRLAELEAGDSFGEEALVSDSRRNATIRMLADGALLRLTKDDFINLIKNPLVQSVTYEQGRELAKGGAMWLDVRFRDEHAQSSIPGSLNMPLNALRTQYDKLDPAKHYIAYCDTGSRSSVAAFLLTERGRDASYLDGGYIRYLAPPAAPSVAEPVPPAREKPKAAPLLVPARVPTGTPIPTTSVADTTEAEVRVSTLKAELARASMQIEEARRLQAEAEAAKVAAEKAMEERVRIEREKLEAEARKAAEFLSEAKRLKTAIENQKRAAEQEAERQRRQQEEHLQRLKREAEQRLEAQKRRLEELYRKNAEELERIQSMKAHAEVMLAADRKKLESETRKQLEAARAVLAEQQEQERKAREENEARLADERRKIEVEFVRNTAMLELVQQEKAAAAAARRAAAEEAEEIIAEYRSEHERARAQEQARLQQEVRQLEEERQRLKAATEDARKAREEAESMQRRAQAQLIALRQLEEERVDRAANHIQVDIRAVEAEAAAAAKRLRDAVMIEERLEEERATNEKRVEQTFNQQVQLRAQLEQDLAEWIAEQDQQTARTSRRPGRSKASQADRIKRKAREARIRTQLHDLYLLEELATAMNQTLTTKGS